MIHPSPKHDFNARQLSPVPSLGGAAPGLCLIWIKDIENIDPPPGRPFGVGYARGISYTVDVQLPSGIVRDVAGVVPSTPRWPHPYLVQGFDIPDSSADVVPKFVLPGAVCNGTVYLLCSELPYTAPCTPQV